MKLYSPLDGRLVHHRVPPGITFADTDLYTGVERGTESKVSCPRVQHNVPGQEILRSLERELSTITLRSRHLHCIVNIIFKIADLTVSCLSPFVMW